MEYFGIDWEGPVNIDVDEREVIIACPLTEVDLEELRSTIQPLSQSNEYEIDIYERTVEFVVQKFDPDA